MILVIVIDYSLTEPAEEKVEEVFFLETVYDKLLFITIVLLSINR